MKKDTDSSKLLPQPTTKVVAIADGYELRVTLASGDEMEVQIACEEGVIGPQSSWELFVSKRGDAERSMDGLKAADLIQIGGAILELAKVAKGGRGS